MNAVTVLLVSVSIFMIYSKHIDLIHQDQYVEVDQLQGERTDLFVDSQSMMSEKILLSEIALDNEFIEIYNPNNHSVDLSDFYLTDATFTPNSQFYYTITNDANPGGGGFGDFHARFPDGAFIPAKTYQTISLLGSINFNQTYDETPTYELYEDNGTADGIPNMREAFAGAINNQGALSNGGEVVILYKWDGTTDLVHDIDYVIWGDKSEGVDKSGSSIDGPDANTVASTYLNDTPIGLQEVASPGDFGLGLDLHRVDYTEGSQTMMGGNGITGSDETSENLADTWSTILSPTPNADESCNSVISLDYSLPSGQFDAAVSIIAEGAIIESSKNVVFAAGSEILLRDDFTYSRSRWES